jgi:Zn-dependent protease with chaperone function
MATITSTAQFEEALSNERKVEFAFENQRWFDLLRFNVTMTTVNAIQRIKDHYADEYAAHYSSYLPPTPTLAELQGYITQNKLLLPIPQREIDTNTQLEIQQNPGY